MARKTRGTRRRRSPPRARGVPAPGGPPRPALPCRVPRLLDPPRDAHDALEAPRVPGNPGQLEGVPQVDQRLVGAPAREGALRLLDGLRHASPPWYETRASLDGRGRPPAPAPGGRRRPG